jgi:hypothetical protein
VQTKTDAKASQAQAAKPFFSSQAAQTSGFFSASPFMLAAPAQAGAVEDGAVESFPAIQTKLTMGAPGDRYEVEADAMADRVVQRMHAGSVRSDAVPSLQGQCTECREAERIQRQVDGIDLLEATDILEEGDVLEEGLQAKADGWMDVPGSVERTLEGGGGGGQAMHPALRDEMESAFEADFSDVRVHTGFAAERLNQDLSAHAFTYGTDIYFDSGKYRPESSDGLHLLAHELTHVMQQTGATSPAVQARVRPGTIQRDDKKKTHVPHTVHVTRTMTQEEFRVEAMRQLFGGVVSGVTWKHSTESYVPANSPYTVLVDVRLLKEHRGAASRERGIPAGAGGGVAGAEERARTFHAGAESDEKSALMKEIDRRYFEAVGDKTETKIKPGEQAKAELWRTIRDEVLFQHEYIANLPPQVKQLIKTSTNGRHLTPADYDKLFAIAKKIEKMPPGQAADYASRVTGTTTDLGVFEAALDKYIAEMAARAKEADERDKIHTKLLGLEELYKKYKLYLTLLSSASMPVVATPYGGGNAGAGIVATRAAMKMRAELETELQRHGFAGVTEFEQYIKKYEKAFEAEAANIAKDLLAKLAGKLYRESERYKDPAQVQAFHQKLGAYRASQAEFEPNARIWNEYAKAQQTAKERSRLPSEGHVKTSDFTSITQAEADAARKKADAAKASAQSEFKALSGEHKIFEEEGLPADKKLDKVALAKASESQLGAMLQAQIQRRMRDVEEAIKEIDDKPELIYKMSKLMPQFYVQQGIKANSIHDLIIQDKMRSDAILKIVKGIALAMVAIALSVITFGAATPVIVAAGAGLAGAGLGVYMAFEEYKEYTQQKNLADVGLADDPSVVWVVLAVLGAGLDVAGAVKAVKALGPAAKAFNAAGDLAEFTKAVRALEQAGEIEARVARAAEKAGEARKALSEATTELGKVLGSKVYSFPGPLLDPDVYKAVVNLARQAIRTGLADAEKFIEQIKLARLKANLGDLSPEELAKAKQAWQEAKALEAAEAAAEAAEKAAVGTYNTTIKWGIQPAIPARQHSSIKGAYWAKRTPQTNPRVDKFELKINPNNESFFLPHPDGGLVQFENVVGTSVVQDGKLIMKARSHYHVADMPSFAAESVLKEARRQVAAASNSGLKVEWLVSDSRAIQQLEALFKKENVAITIRPLAE